ncbi:hypothetical protein GF325_01225 [Candidatus Bathyarchaeota archaeon]|nr:hypothetical protein [Candidatus Bathyarchaeota archaeon]
MPSYHFLFPFHETPLNMPFPLKALTSQGKRFDVFARMLDAMKKFALHGRDVQVEGLFKEDDDQVPRVLARFANRNALTHDSSKAGGCLPNSELGIAKFFNDVLGSGDIKRRVPDYPIFIDRLPARGGNTGTAFLHRVKSLKKEGREAWLFHEAGDPVIKLIPEESITLCFSPSDIPEKLLVIIGSNLGFPPTMEQDLLSVADKVFSISPIGAAPRQVPLSYLGSHVISILCMLFPPE